MSNKTLNSISILFFLFILAAVLINLFTTNNYGRANSQVVKMFQGDDYIFTNLQLYNALQGPLSGYQFVDLREEKEFGQGHLPEALNISFDRILDKKNLRTLEKSKDKIIVLYANNEAEAHTARMILLSKGMGNDIRVMGGSYQTAVNYVIEKFNPAFATYRDEKAKFDYRRYMQATPTASGNRDDKPAGMVPQIKTQTVAVQGGC